MKQLDFSNDDRAHWTHRLGNLVLLNRAKNSEAQNYDFTSKKTKYFTSKLGTVTFALTAQVLNYENWTPEALAKRRDSLLYALSTAWDLWARTGGWGH